MIYIVSEDKGAACEFWKRLCVAKFGADRVQVKSAEGNRNLISTLRELTDLGRGDKVILALDNNGQDFLATVLDTIRDYCLFKSCALSVSTYFCLEEWILSYEYTEILGGCTDTYLLGLLSIVRSFVHIQSPQTGGYYVRSEFDDFIRKHNTNGREHLAYQLLNFILSNRKMFKFEKGMLGDCWLTDCKDTIEIHNNYACRQCMWKDEGMTALDKTHHFGHNCMHPFHETLVNPSSEG